MLSRKRLCYFILIFFGIVNFAVAQIIQDSIIYVPEVEYEFVEAMKFFRDRQFDSASIKFIKSIKIHPRSHRATGAYIMGGKALYEIGNYRESIRLLKDLIDLYPQSDYEDDARYSLGLNYYRLGRYEDATSEFVWVFEQSNEPRLVLRSQRMTEMLTASHLTLSELKMLLPEAKKEAMKALINMRVAEKLLRTGDLNDAEGLLQNVANMPPNIKYADEARNILEQMKRQGGIKIGVALPLMLKSDNAEMRSLGLEFLQGIQLAIDEYNLTVPVKIGVDVRDTEKDPSVAARQVADLCSDEKVSVIIGPIISSEVFACAGIANERGVPLITPTATANGIAAIGPYIFQANPDFDTRGRCAATYAFHSLSARTFAVLSPIDAIGKQMADSFISEVELLGGELIDAQFYHTGSTDLRTELMSIRRKALEKIKNYVIDFSAKIRHTDINKLIKWGVSARIVDSLVEKGLTAQVTYLFGERGAIIADSLGFQTRIEHLKYDSLGLPVTNIDVIFVPIASYEEIPIISSQIKFFNLQGKILGTGEWYDIAALDQNKQYTDGLIFFVDTDVNQSDGSFKEFEEKFRLANKDNQPRTNALFGYDVAKMIVQIISQGKIRRKDIANAISGIKDYKGLRSKISLSNNRVNSYMTVMEYKKRQVKKIGEIDLATIGK